ncbi:hypothetical protein ACERK3_00780 [Phycisphaerales bacterium AB-hyl4]|uniref:Uncharacterized protein n=1 Tax=Natronomicrosphaera hydrolytica TaxID=3242702 RepID=A0ABV4U0X0_9BACT
MYRGIWIATLAMTAMSFVAAPAAAQRLSERIEHVRQQRAQEERANNERAQEQGVAQRLQGVIDNANFENTTAQEAVRWWSEQTGIPVVVDWDAMLMEGVDGDTRITMSLRRVPANQLLVVLLRMASPDVELIAEASQWYVEIMTRSQANRRPTVRIYDINDLLHVVPNFNNAPRFDLESALDADHVGGGRGGGGRGGGGGGGRGGGGGGGGLFGDTGTDRDDTEIPSRRERAEELIDMIRNTIAPEIWLEHGGEYGSIRYYNGHLIVSAPNYVHQQIGSPINMRPRPTARGGSRTRADNERRSTAPLQGERPARSRGVAGRQ